MRGWFERVGPDAKVEDAAGIMVVTGQEALPVVEDERLIGIIAERDIFDRLLRDLTGDLYTWGLGSVDNDPIPAYRRIAASHVRDVMTTNLVTVAPQTPALRAAGIMRARRIRRLPVVDGDRAVGLIFMTDIHRALLAENLRLEGPVIRSPAAGG
jgi:CBS domain-containing protein